MAIIKRLPVLHYSVVLYFLILCDHSAHSEGFQKVCMDLAALCHDVDMALLHVPFENYVVIIGHSSYVLLSDDFVAGRAIVRLHSSGTRNYAPQIRIVAQLSRNLDMFEYILFELSCIV